MTLRQSIQNLIDSSKPDSPTDVIFLFGALIALDLWIYATLAKVMIPHIGDFLLFLTGCKAVKVTGKILGGPNAPATPQVNP